MKRILYEDLISSYAKQNNVWIVERDGIPETTVVNIKFFSVLEDYSKTCLDVPDYLGHFPKELLAFTIEEQALEFFNLFTVYPFDRNDEISVALYSPTDGLVSENQ